MSTLTSYNLSNRPSASSNTGLCIFRTDNNAIEVSDGTSWQAYNSDGVLVPGVSNSFSGSFDGTDDWIGIGNLSNLNSATNFTISVWFKQLQSLETGMLLGGTGSNGIGMYPYSSGDFFVHAGMVGSLSAAMPDTDDFINAVVTRDASNTKLYFNGTLAATVTSSTIPSTAGNSFRIGTYTHYASSLPELEGNIDEVAIWDATTLDATNILAIYNTGVPIDLSSDVVNYDQSSTLTHWYRLGDHASDTGSGGVANGNTITNIENAANPGTNDGSTINGTPSFSTTVPS